MAATWRSGYGPGVGEALPETPTVLTLATAARTSSERLLERYAIKVNDNVNVVPGHLVAEQASGVTDWQPLGDALAVEPTPVLVDLGRLHSGSPVLPVAAAAVAVVVVSRADPASVIRLRERLSRLVPALAARRTRRCGCGRCSSPRPAKASATSTTSIGCSVTPPPAPSSRASVIWPWTQTR